MRRAIRSLEKRGFVATRLFGRERPYRITRHGIAVLASIVPDTGTPRIIYPSEILILCITGILGAAAYLYPQIAPDPVWDVAFTLSSAFFTLFGISIMICWRVARRVI
jgi:hypothetical protein